mmetsp:Transcript_11169/g.25379  ORF Transcript_11169/g.25379 Transcript_11169/m.25379 type:complete len:213 (-) Transcript_11169:727-1365(-)
MCSCSSWAIKLLHVKMIIDKTISAHKSAIVLLNTVRKRMRNSVKAVAALNVRANFSTFTRRNNRATLKFMPPSKFKMRVKIRSIKVPNTTKMSNTLIASWKIVRPNVQNRKMSSTVNQMVKKTSMSSIVCSHPTSTPVLDKLPSSSPAIIPSSSKRMIMPTTFANIIAVQKSSKPLEAKALLIGLDHSAPPRSTFAFCLCNCCLCASSSSAV